MSYRHKVSKRGSRKLFKRTSKTRAVNVIRPLRGGFRL